MEVAISQAAGAYPITSSTSMCVGFNTVVMNGGKNLIGDSLMFFEPESEHSAASVCEGFAVAGFARPGAAYAIVGSSSQGSLSLQTVASMRDGLFGSFHPEVCGEDTGGLDPLD